MIPRIPLDSDPGESHYEEEPLNSETDNTQSDETLDMAILQELVRDEGSNRSVFMVLIYFRKINGPVD